MASTRYVNRLTVHHVGPAPHAGVLTAGGVTVPCALGRSGIRTLKREGDGATPKGVFPLRKLYFRPDRGPVPQIGLERQATTPDLGWCDDPASGAYNTPVTLPFAASHERLWRDDHLYDLVIVIAYNTDLPKKGAGSAIFLHLAREGSESPGFLPTEGCVALRRPDLIRLLPRIGPETVIGVR